MANSRETQPTVLFCLGAAKAGTSWLFEYLRAHPEAHLRSIKELHYFDALDHENQGWQANRLREKRNAIVEVGSIATIGLQHVYQQQINDCEDLIALHGRAQEDPDAYLAYLVAGRENEPLVGDITPAYALLSTARLAKMADVARKTRFIYVLRDPVARLWSHIRMIAGRKSSTGAQIQTRSNQIFWRMERGSFRDIWERCDYKSTIERMKAALDPSQMLIVFYEDLFSYETIERICNFLGIGLSTAKLLQPVHVGPDAEMNSAQYQRAHELLAPQYAYIRANFKSVPTAWLEPVPGISR